MSYSAHDRFTFAHEAIRGYGYYVLHLARQITALKRVCVYPHCAKKREPMAPKNKVRTVNEARNRVARLAREYIAEHYSEAVHIEDLCRVTGVGVRTLQRCFREYFNLTVSNYLKAVRLDSARRQLLAAHRSDTSVTRIAMQNGCTHLGRFSVEFREHFGQSPRQILAMEAGQK